MSAVLNSFSDGTWYPQYTPIPKSHFADGSPRWVDPAAISLRAQKIINISNLQVYDGKMFIMLDIADHACAPFFYPIDCIDHPALAFKIRWKFAGDSTRIFQATAFINMLQTDPGLLEIDSWGFYRATAN